MFNFKSYSKAGSIKEAIRLLQENPEALIIAGGDYGWISQTIGFGAVVLAMINVVGGFLVTDRMLEMFKKDRS